MAEPPANPSQSTHAASAELRNLRALAQSHITHIETEDAADAVHQAAGQRELERYAKPRRKDRARASISLSPPPDTKGARLRSAQDVLDRLKHDPTFDLAEYRVGYLERFEGIREMAAGSWIGESTDEDWIPLHRVRYVKRVAGVGKGEEVVWDRDKRIDRIFGSGIVEEEGRDGDGSVYGGVALS